VEAGKLNTLADQALQAHEAGETFGPVTRLSPRERKILLIKAA
jgi:hypothetical protein